MNGKSTCQALKAIRRDIAAENGIPLEIPECSYQGHCPGTCPQCEREARILERELAKRLTLGKAATIAGIALTLAAPATALAQKPLPKRHPQTQVADTAVAFRFNVIDAKTKDSIPFVNVTVKKGDKIIKYGQSDLEFNVVIRGIKEGKYDIEFRGSGYHRKILKDVSPARNSAEATTVTIALDPDGIIQEYRTLGIIGSRMIEYNAGATTQQEIEINGLKVKAKY